MGTSRPSSSRNNRRAPLLAQRRNGSNGYDAPVAELQDATLEMLRYCSLLWERRNLIFGLTVVAVLAAGLWAVRCELVKDVPGFFSADPNRNATARHLPLLTFAEALELADRGCDLVQRKAIEAAADIGLPLVVRSLNGSALMTLVSAGAPQIGRASCRERVSDTV